MADIDSETKFIWKLFLNILLTPFTLLLILFGKKHIKDLFSPFKLIAKFVFEAKFTIAMILLNVFAIPIVIIFFGKAGINSMMNYPQDLLNPKRYYSLIASGFWHSSFTHLLGNMIALFVFGRVVERKLGFFKTSLVYFGALLISSVIDSAVNIFLGKNIPSCGASGAIMGLVAAAMLLDPLYITYDAILPLPIMIVGWLTMYADIMGVLSPMADGIAHFAHLGGYLSIALTMFLLGVEERGKLKKGLIINLVSLVIIGGIYFLMKGFH
jgi:membrane associated rhomboid family serine protease